MSPKASEPPVPQVSSPRRGRGGVLLGAVFLILAAAVVGAVALLGNPLATSPAPSGTFDPLGVRHLDPDAPAVPLPVGVRLINAWVEGSGLAAYRLASWTTPTDYQAVVNFYARLHDDRWAGNGTPTSVSARNHDYLHGLTRCIRDWPCSRYTQRVRCRSTSGLIRRPGLGTHRPPRNPALGGSCCQEPAPVVAGRPATSDGHSVLGRAARPSRR